LTKNINSLYACQAQQQFDIIITPSVATGQTVKSKRCGSR